jgi:TadE-like protein
MMYRSHRKNNLKVTSAKDGGAAMIEFAFIFPVLALLVFGIIQFGMVLGADLSLRNGANVGARTAALYDTNAKVCSPTLADPSGKNSCTARYNNILATIQNAVAAPINGATLGVGNLTVDDQVQVPPGSGNSATKITLKYNYPLLIPWVYPGAVGGVVQLDAEATMR